MAGLKSDFRDRSFERFFGFMPETHREVTLGQALNPCAKIFLQPVVTGIGDKLVQIVCDRSYVFGDAPLVVIQDADEFFSGVRNIV